MFEQIRARSAAHSRCVLLQPLEDTEQLRSEQVDGYLRTVGVQGGQETYRRQAAGGSILWTRIGRDIHGQAIASA